MYVYMCMYIYKTCVDGTYVKEQDRIPSGTPENLSHFIVTEQAF